MEKLWILAPVALAAFTGFGLVSCALGVAPLLRASQLTAWTVALSAFLVAAFGACGVVAFGLVRASLFGALMLVFIDLALVVPACGATLLLRARRVPATRTARWIAWLGVALLIPAGWATLVEPYRLVVERTDVPLAAARAGAAPIKVALLADLQATAVRGFERRAVARLMAEEPDLILIPGDLYQGRDLWTAIPAYRALLGQLHAPGGVYLVSGDCDPERDALAAMIEGTDVRLLEHQTAHITLHDRKLTILGLVNGRHAADEIDAFASADGDDDIRIVLAHQPRVALYDPPGGRIDLYVAGHTHGGQVAIPFFGPPITLSPMPRHVAAGGLHESGGTRVYVSRGVGMERSLAPRVRLFCRPEVSLLTLE